MIVTSPERFRAGTRSTENPSRLVHHSQDGDGGRARSDPYPRLTSRPDCNTPSGPNHTVPSYGTVPVFARVPGNKLSGYDQPVPEVRGNSPLNEEQSARLRIHAGSTESLIYRPPHFPPL
jgi:hypothetical protein